MANEFKVRKGLIVQGSGSNIFDVQGSQGQLFSITDSLSGSLFSVNDISGIPIMEVFSDNTIKLGTFNQEAIIISGSRTGMGLATPQAKLHISGASNSGLFEIDSPAVNNIIYVSGSGNVGIGTGTPTNTLQVSGSLWTTTITASSLPNSLQPNVIGYDSSTGTLTYMPTASISASSPTLIQSLTANVTVGGVSSGTSFNSGSQLEQVLRSILITFIPATISSLTVRNGASTITLSNRDVNDFFAINTASFTATADNPNNRLPQSASFTASNADSAFQHYLSDTLTTSNAFGLGSSRTITRASSDGTVTFTVRALRPDNGSIISTTATVSFLYRNYLAASSTIVSDISTAQTVIAANVASTLASSKSWTATCTAANNNGSNYTYIIYPASYGSLSNVIQNGALSVLTAFTSLGDYTITTPTYGASVSMRFYKSNSPGAFAAATSLAIS